VIKRKISVPIYGIDVNIIVLGKDEDHAKLLPNLPNDLLEGSTVAHCIIDDTGNASIILDKDYCDDDTVTHEVFHLTIAILNSAGIRMSDKSEEAYAYLNGYLNGKILKIIDKIKSTKHVKQRRK
jgi:hypothetical protein